MDSQRFECRQPLIGAWMRNLWKARWPPWRSDTSAAHLPMIKHFQHKHTPSTDRNFKLKHNLINTHVPLTSYFLETTLTNCTSWKPLAMFRAPVQVGVHAAAGAWCCARAASTWHPAQTCVVFNFLLSPFLKIFSTSESFIKKREKKIYIQGHKPKPFCCK